MDIVFLDDGRAKLQMKGYLVKAIEAYGKRIKHAKTPARNDHFIIDSKSELLPKEEADIFHSVVYILL